MDSGPGNNVTHNDTLDFNYESHYEYLKNMSIIFIFICVVCAFGLVGNGTVIWFLGFHIKRNPFTTYILNLAVADFGLLVFLLPVLVFYLMPEDVFVFAYMETAPFLETLIYILVQPFLFMYSIGQLFLTAISMDRCVAALFPIWHRCHRPPHLSTIVCVLIWVISFLFHGIVITFQVSESLDPDSVHYPTVLNVLLCLPLTTISTLILFIRFCFKSQQQRRGKLLVAILLTLLFFLLFAFPLNAFYLNIHFFHYKSSFSNFINSTFDYLPESGLLCASLNSSVNPLIYFLVGRKKRGRSRESVKAILQRVFKENEGSQVESELTEDTQL